MLITESQLKHVIRNIMIKRMLKEGQDDPKNSESFKVFANFLKNDLYQVQALGENTTEMAEKIVEDDTLLNNWKQACKGLVAIVRNDYFDKTIQSLKFKDLLWFNSLSQDILQRKPYIFGQMKNEVDSALKQLMSQTTDQKRVNQFNEKGTSYDQYSNEQRGFFKNYSPDKVEEFNDNVIKALEMIEKSGGEKIWDSARMQTEIAYLKKHKPSVIVNDLYAYKFSNEYDRRDSNFSRQLKANYPAEILFTNLINNESELKQAKQTSPLLTSIITSNIKDVAKRIIKTYNYRKQNKSFKLGFSK